MNLFIHLRLPKLIHIFRGRNRREFTFHQPLAVGNHWLFITIGLVLGYVPLAQTQPCTPPALTITASPALTIATGMKATLTVSVGSGLPADSYTWSAGGVHSTTVSAGSAGTYSVTAVSGGCYSTTSVQVVQVAPIPINSSVWPCNIDIPAGNGVPNYLFFHGDGTHSSTFAVGESIYSFGQDVNPLCRNPTVILPIYANLPPEATVISPNAITTLYFIFSSGGVVSKSCGKVGPTQYAWGTYQIFSLATPGAYPVTFIDGHTETITVSADVAPKTASTVSISAVPGSAVWPGTAVMFSATPSNVPASVANDPTINYKWYKNNISVATATQPSTYTVNAVQGDAYKVLMSPSCGLQSIPSNAIVLSVASPTATASPTVVCTDGSVSLSASVPSGTAPFSYTWIAPAGITLADNSSSAVTGTVSSTLSGVQTFTLHVTDSTTPTAFNSTTVSVTITATPTMSIAASPSLTITQGNTATLTASGADAYSWSTGETSPAISASSAATYSVTGTSSAGCSATASVALSLTQATATVDLTPSLILPQANFAASGLEATRYFAISLVETGGQTTASGATVITITIPLGYAITFDNTSTSIDVTGGATTPVNNADWTVSSSSDLQLTLTMKPGQTISANSHSTLGFTISRAGASKGSANITINVNDDATSTYDVNAANNIFARVINAL